MSPRVFHLYPRGDRLKWELVRRIAELIAEDLSPRNAMSYIETRLDEAGLWFGTLRADISPRDFAFNILIVNPAMDENIGQLRLVFAYVNFVSIDEMLSCVVSGGGGD